jgi:hypothetical protein
MKYDENKEPFFRASNKMTFPNKIINLWFAERVQPGTICCKPDYSAGRTLGAPD